MDDWQGGKMSDIGVRVRYGIADKSYENEFFRYFAKALKAYFEQKGINALLIGMPKCLVFDKLQIDALLLTDNKMVIIDFKRYSGELILPDEQSFRSERWETSEGVLVRGGSCPNPFCQTGLQRERLSTILETSCSDLSCFNPRHITTMVCFSEDMQVIGEIPGRYRPCFFIADRNNFLEKLFDIVSAGKGSAGLLEPKFLDYFNTEIFKSSEYDLSVTPEALGVFQNPTYRFGKLDINEAIRERIEAFFESDIPVLTVTGTVGSGKTGISSALREAALNAGFSSARVFALSNRVKNNLLGSIDEVESLYSAIYDFTSTKIAEDGSKLIPLAEIEEPRAFDDLDEEEWREAKGTKTAFIVYESQMITDTPRVGGAVQFGSGKLLSDVLEHLGITRGDSGNKIVFVGDKYQLSFGSWSESCLNPDYYHDALRAATIELPDTRTPNGIQRVCIDIANAIRAGRLSHLVISPNEQVSICDPGEEAKLIREAETSWKSHELLAYTNSQASALNGYIKQRVKQNGARYAAGDVVIFENEVLAYPPSSAAFAGIDSVFEFGSPEPRRITNGTFGTIVRIGGESAVDVVVNGSDAPVRLTLVEADVRISLNGVDETLEIQFIKELLESEDTKLSVMEDIALRIHLERLFREALVKEPFEESRYFEDMLASGEYVIAKDGRYRDPEDGRFRTSYENNHRQEVQKKILKRGTEYFRWANAAQIKFGWCMTVHKAMSYRWSTVTFTSRVDGGRRNEGYFRFLYTGISRAREHVNLVRWDPVSPFETTEFGTSGQSTSASDKGVLFRANGDDVNSEILAVVGGLSSSGFCIKSSKQAQYQVICEIESGSSSAKVIFFHNKKGEVTRLSLANGDKNLFADFKVALIESLGCDKQTPATPMAWLYDHLNANILSESILEIEEASNYLDILKARREGEAVLIRANYRKDQTVSNFKFMSGSMALYSDIVEAIKAYYLLG